MTSTISIVRQFCGQQRILTIPVALLEFLDNDLHTTLLLSQIIYWYDWTEKQGRAWFYKTDADWMQELHMGRKTLDRCRRILKSKGYIETKVFRVVDGNFKGDPVNHYKITPKLAEQLHIFFSASHVESEKLHVEVNNPAHVGLHLVGKQATIRDDITETIPF